MQADALLSEPAKLESLIFIKEMTQSHKRLKLRRDVTKKDCKLERSIGDGAGDRGETGEKGSHLEGHVQCPDARWCLSEPRVYREGVKRKTYH